MRQIRWKHGVIPLFRERILWGPFLVTVRGNYAPGRFVYDHDGD